MARINGWDERDYKLWSDLGVLPSYGRVDGTDHLVSLKQVEELLRKHARERFEKAHTDREIRKTTGHTS